MVRKHVRAMRECGWFVTNEDELKHLPANEAAEERRLLSEYWENWNCKQTAREDARLRAIERGDIIVMGDGPEMTNEQAERVFGFSPCQVRYGRWPNGMRVKHV